MGGGFFCPPNQRGPPAEPGLAFPPFTGPPRKGALKNSPWRVPPVFSFSRSVGQRLQLTSTPARTTPRTAPAPRTSTATIHGEPVVPFLAHAEVYPNETGAGSAARPDAVAQ